MFKYFLCWLLHETEPRRDLMTPYGTVKRLHCMTCKQQREFVAIRVK
jgi:hypothetical protein